MMTLKQYKIKEEDLNVDTSIPCISYIFTQIDARLWVPIHKFIYEILPIQLKSSEIGFSVALFGASLENLNNLDVFVFIINQNS